MINFMTREFYSFGNNTISHFDYKSIFYIGIDIIMQFDFFIYSLY